MTISWHGDYTIKIISRSFVLVANPHAQINGLQPFRSKADIVVLSNPLSPEMSYINGLQGNPEIIDQPGEYSLHNMSIYARGWHSLPNNHEQSMHRWNIEGITILYLGSLNRKLEQIELQELEKTNIDILFVPIGGFTSIDTPQALDIVTTIEPHIVIPIHFKFPSYTEKIETVDKFASEMGISARSKQDKLSIVPNKINREVVTTYILEP